MYEYVIIGAGVAGICAANRLADLGKKPLVIEGGEYPAHKVCGEFLSYESLTPLRNWGIVPSIKVDQAYFQTANNQYTFTLPRPCAGMPQLKRDQMLLDYARTQGVTVLTKTQVTEISEHRLTLSTGETILAKNLIVATGRLPQFFKKPSVFHYTGYKTHLEGVSLKNNIEMYLFPGAYIGLVAIEENKANVVCLTKSGQIETLIPQYKNLERYFSEGNRVFDWLSCQIPHFGIKQIPVRPNTYFIGDAAGSIPPITGDGVAMAITSGIMAANFAIRGDAEGFRTAWLKTYKSQVNWGLFLHKLMLNPVSCTSVISLCKLLPKLTNFLYFYTRGGL